MIHWNAIVLETETCSMATIFPVSNIASQIIDKFTSRDLKFKWFCAFLRILETRFRLFLYKKRFLFIIMAFCNVTSFRDEFQPGELLFFQIISIIYTIMGIVSLICIQGQAQIEDKLPPRKQTKIEKYCSTFIERFIILIFIGGILGLCAFYVPITDDNRYRLKGAFVCMIVFCILFTIPVSHRYLAPLKSGRSPNTLEKWANYSSCVPPLFRS